MPTAYYIILLDEPVLEQDRPGGLPNWEIVHESKSMEICRTRHITRHKQIGRVVAEMVRNGHWDHRPHCIMIDFDDGEGHQMVHGCKQLEDAWFTQRLLS